VLVRLGRDLSLEARLPSLVRHAVDDLSRLLLAKGHAFSSGSILVPIGEAISAKAGKLHKLDVMGLSGIATSAS
jgi:hypothetical protein